MPRRRQEIKIKEFHKSLSNEFEVLKNRVRFLIGDQHWGEEGRYKEILMMNMIKRYLPNNLSVGTGFIMNNDNYESISSQIDIIIYKNQCPLIFKEESFVIVNSKNVVGVIEIKSTFENSKFANVLAKSEEISNLVSHNIFNGVFYYSLDSQDRANNERRFRDNDFESIKNIIMNLNGKVNHISLGKDYFVKYWKNGNPEIGNNFPSYSIYEIRELSFSYFLFNLIELTYQITSDYLDGIDELDWFLYPIEGTKESCRKDNIEITRNI